MLQSLAKLNAFELHKLVLHRLKCQSQATTTTDLDVIRSNHRFLWDDDTEPEDWENRLAKKYYSKLFKEYCICDLSHYKDNKIAMRWRTEAEVVAGKGQFVCGSKCCPEKKELRSWEVNFTYVEGSQKKTALVKLRLCSSCSRKLNYRSQKRLAKKQKRLKTFKESAGPGPTMSFSAHETEDPLNTEEGDAQEKVISASTTESKERNVWSEKVHVEEKSREEEFGEYLEDLLL